MASKVKLTERAQRYLNCINDWKAPFEVVTLLGTTPPEPVENVRNTLIGLMDTGLAEHHTGNNTFRISDEGRFLLRQSRPAGRALLSSGKTGN